MGFVCFQVLKKHNLDEDDKIDRTELDNAFKDVSKLIHSETTY